MRPNFIASFLFFCSATVLASDPQFDTGFIEWTQPDNKTFIAKAWGDEYAVWFETDNGYRFVTGPDGWHYYATLDQYGEFAPSEYRVEIDNPPSFSYQLERTRERMDQIEQFRAEVNSNLDAIFQHYSQLQSQRNTESRPLTIRINVLLVEFVDVPHYASGTRPDGYFKADFDSMLFSHNSWIDFTGSMHPEGDSIFGSLRDFYDQMSLGRFAVNGGVVNPEDSNGVPIWISLPQPRSFYNENGTLNSYRRLFDTVFARAVSYGWLTPADTASDSLKYIVLYANNVVTGGTQWVSAYPNWGFMYISERKGPVITTNDPTFTHFGWPAHEFGHLIGFKDEYDSPSSTFDYDLMAVAEHSGPNRKGACPGSLSPYYRIGMNWVTPVQIAADTTNFALSYSYSSPRFYRIDPVGATEDEHYIIETRLRQGFDRYLPNHFGNFPNQAGVLLIWHHNGIDGQDVLDKTCLMFADDVAGNTTYPTDFFPKEVVPNRQSFNDLSTPPAILGFHFTPSPPQFHRERPAHFALNGIHRSGDSTIIDTIALHHAMVSTAVINGWQMLSVPVVVPDFDKDTVWSTSTSTASEYVPGTGYVPRDTLKNGVGYWIRFGSAHNVIMAGGNIDWLSMPVSAGWNLIGSISDKIPLSTNVCLFPATNTFTSQFFTWRNGYVQVDSIVPGVGHWIKVEEDGSVLFNRDPISCDAPEMIAEGELDHFTITDAQGKKQDLYVANLDHNPSLGEMDLSMPPPFPEAGFDARFEDGEFIKAVSPDSGVVELVINVDAQVYPVTVTWELNPENGIEYSITTEGMGKRQGSNGLTRSGSIVMTSSSGGKLRLNAQAGSASKRGLPTAYMLAQNYPNPFNPITRIHFELPHDGNVRLVVYDLLGREVKALVNEFKVAGRYDTSFDAASLASGVYFYRLQADTFNDVKKLVLLR